MSTTPACSTGDNPISATEACEGFRQCAELQVCGQSVFWLASEPSENIVCLWQSDAGGTRRLDTGPGSIRSQLNGYGGGAYAVLPEFICWVAGDQKIWILNRRTGTRSVLIDEPGAVWGGLVADAFRHRWLAVRENGGCQSLIAVEPTGRMQTLHQGQDFYSAPAVSEDGREIAWVSWQLPDMPWVRTRLWTARFDDNGKLVDARAMAPPVEGSVQQPRYVGSQLWVMSDHQGWWQPWRVVTDGGRDLWQRADVPDLDHANAPWQLAECHACPSPSGGWARVRYRRGIGELWLHGNEAERRVAGDYTDFRALSTRTDKLLCIARSPDRLDSVIEICPGTGRVVTLSGGETPLPSATLVRPESVMVPASNDGSHPVQGFLYAPLRDSPEPPPLILVAHGGPTSAAYATYNPQAQFWCQRGFAVVEVNYTGSSGFGREYRQALAGNWGIADVADMFRMADHLVRLGRADPGRLFIQGRSSGGYTALMAAAADGARLAGLASLFGVTDPMRLKAATHRFESGYLDWLLGPPGADGKNWRCRTPALMASHINCPAIFFQGRQDRIVVPEQTRIMVQALQAAGQTAELQWFDDEGHGFRRIENQARVLECLWRFYSRLPEG
ncbi:MAG: prolyl oligopeptidase family serine peptidase [Pseudomonadota bacterium]